MSNKERQNAQVEIKQQPKPSLVKQIVEKVVAATQSTTTNK